MSPTHRSARNERTPRGIRQLGLRNVLLTDIPALDYVPSTNGELERLATVSRGVKLVAILQGTRVVRRDLSPKACINASPATPRTLDHRAAVA